MSRMIGELIVDHDQVGLPGVGTFVAEMVPASFSDKGFTINPPYRRLSFYPSRLEDTLLIDFYAASNRIDRESAQAYILQYLAELRSVLEQRKTVALPGLGRLRATRENAFFFVPDEGLDIFPAGIGLHPVSLKSHVQPEDPVVINVPLPVRTVAQPEPFPEQVPEDEELKTVQEAVEEEIPEQVPEDEEVVQEEVETVQETAEEEIPEQVPGDEEVVQEEVETVQEAVEEEIPEQGRKDAGLIWKDMEEEAPRSRWWITVLVVLGLLAVFALAAFLVAASFAPDFIDSILYTPEELEIINF